MDYYHDDTALQCRLPKITAAALGIPLNLKFVSLKSKDTRKPAFLKINPDHCLPTLVDGDFTLWESRAICTYMVNKYGQEDDPLYPRDPHLRATIDKLLFYQMELHTSYRAYLFCPLMEGKPLELTKLLKVMERLQFINETLAHRPFIACSHETVADHAYLSIITDMITSGIDMSHFKNILAWKHRLRNIPGYKANEKGAEDLGKCVRHVMTTKNLHHPMVPVVPKLEFNCPLLHQNEKECKMEDA